MITFYDKTGKQLDEITFIECQWERKYSEAGSFSIYCAAADWNFDIKYLMNTDRKETAIVQKIVFEKKTEGNFITASGFFLEKVLSWGCNYEPVTLTASTEAAVKAAITTLMTKDFSSNSSYKQLGEISFSDDSTFPASINQSLDPGTDFASVLYDSLQENGMSFWCEPVFHTDESAPLLGVVIHTYKGADRSGAVFFSEGYNDVSDVSYTLDESAEYPLYGIMQEVQAASGFDNVISVNTKEGVKYFISETIAVDTNCPSDLGACWPLKVITGSVSGMEMVSANQQAIRDAMKQQATTDMLNHYKIETITANVIQETFLYLENYDLGDICTVILDDLKQMFVARIAEIEEVHRNNTVEITLTLGTPQKTKYRAVRV
ncbi:Gp37-like protein [Mobilibacterium timonense]|uniref:Gp37-like protein n=1 Tax=Mobilibacterium timonense TaxID=1871012 RepID=UPI000985E345|nr:hypothetical protein [Mobilibacterium timonense]